MKTRYGASTQASSRTQYHENVLPSKSYAYAYMKIDSPQLKIRMRKSTSFSPLYDRVQNAENTMCLKTAILQALFDELCIYNRLSITKQWYNQTY